jgi:hypothetical protein
MKRKFSFAFLITVFITMTGFAQSTKEKIEVHAKDPSTKENAVRADRLIIQNKKITDTTMSPSSPVLTNQERIRKKKRCAKPKQ